MSNDDCEVKCVVGIDGAVFGIYCEPKFIATGNTAGIVKVYQILTM